MTDYKVVKLMRNGVEYCIPKGSEVYCLDYLVVGGGGGGGGGRASSGNSGGGGGGGGVKECTAQIFNSSVMNVCVGKGGNGGTCGYCKCNLAKKGGASSLGNIYVSGGGCGGSSGYSRGAEGGEGGSGGGGAADGFCCYLYLGGYANGFGKGNCGGTGVNHWAGGGGGAGSTTPHNLHDVCLYYYQVAASCNCYQCHMSYGGDPLISNISGNEYCYAAGGGAGCGCGGCGGGNGCLTGAGTNATNYGAGGGGGYTTGGKGGDGIVIVRYPKDGSYGITNAIGGCKYECGDYCIHCFTQDGYFAINPTGCHISYLAVGGGAGICNHNGGGGGEVLFGTKQVENNSISIVVGGCGGSDKDGCDSCIGEDIIARGGKLGYRCNNIYYGGTSGSGCLGSKSCFINQAGAGGGASGNASPISHIINCYTNQYGGTGYFGYGGGGTYSDCFFTAKATDGGVGLQSYASCGGGAGITEARYTGLGGKGVVDICYPADGTYGFTTATGGDCCYQCGDMCVHRFTSDGTFTIVS